MKATFFTVLFLASTIACQGNGNSSDSPKPAQDPQAVLKEVLASFKKEGIKLDAKARTVTVPVVVNRMQDPVE